MGRLVPAMVVLADSALLMRHIQAWHWHGINPVLKATAPARVLGCAVAYRESASLAARGVVIPEVVRPAVVRKAHLQHLHTNPRKIQPCEGLIADLLHEEAG